MSTRQHWALVNLRAKRSENFELTFWKEIVPLVKWWTAKTTEPNNRPLSFLVGLLLHSYLSHCCCYWSWPLTWPAHRLPVRSVFPVSHWSNVWANRMWTHRQETYITFYRSSVEGGKKQKKKGGRTNANSPNARRELFVFVVLIAAQSTGNVRAKVFQSALQK